MEEKANELKINFLYYYYLKKGALKYTVGQSFKWHGINPDVLQSCMKSQVCIYHIIVEALC